MAAGLPVVATNVGGNPEIVQDGITGILVPARDPAALSAAMIRILQSPSLARQFGEAGRARVAAHFSLESTVRQTEDLYLNLLDDRAWRHARDALRAVALDLDIAAIAGASNSAHSLAVLRATSPLLSPSTATLI